MDTRPLLFLDVDGVLSPFVDESPAWDDWVLAPGMGFHLPLSPEMARRLAALPVRIVWLTTWEDNANKYVSPALGWPTFDVVNRGLFSGWWKPAALRSVMAAHDVPFIWIDDDVDNPEMFDSAEMLLDAPDVNPVRAKMAAYAEGRNLAHLVLSPDRNVGITSDDIVKIEAFLAGLMPVR